MVKKMSDKAQPISMAEINARIMELEHQRSTSQARGVLLRGQIACLEEEIKALKEDAETQKLIKEELQEIEVKLRAELKEARGRIDVMELKLKRRRKAAIKAEKAAEEPEQEPKG